MQSSTAATTCGGEPLAEIKTQLITREGVYTLVPQAEYCRPKPNASIYATNSVGVVGQLGAGIGIGCSSGVGGGGGGGGGGSSGNSSNNPPVRISFTKVYYPYEAARHYQQQQRQSPPSQSSLSSTHSNDRLDRTGGGGSVSTNTNHSNTLNHHNIIQQQQRYHHHQHSQCDAQQSHNHHRSQQQNDDQQQSKQQQQQSSLTTSSAQQQQHERRLYVDERICFNIGREIFIYAFKGLQPSDLNKLIDRRMYKACSPTCHDFCSNLDYRVSLLVVGFNAGQIQMMDLYRADVNKFYNQERLIEKSKVTCIRWLPQSKSNFLVSYSSGQMYLFKEDLTCGTTVPNYQLFKQGEGYAIYTCKTKSSRNPIFRWSIGEGAIHEFAFSPSGELLATVSQDGFLRLFHYDSMELLGRMRSYFGGLLCVAWSPDSKFIVTGGEDDLITVWSAVERRVIARGQGHKSWVNVVAFDPYMTTYNVPNATDVDIDGHSIDGNDDIELDDDNDIEDDADMGDQKSNGGGGGELTDDDDDEDGDGHLQQQQQRTTTGQQKHHNARYHQHHHQSSQSTITNRQSTPPPPPPPLRQQSLSKSISNEFQVTSYRIGSVGQDTQICFWDLTDDVFRQSAVTNTTATTTTNGGGNGNHHHHQLQPQSIKSRSSLINTSTSSTINLLSISGQGLNMNISNENLVNENGVPPPPPVKPLHHQSNGLLNNNSNNNSGSNNSNNNNHHSHHHHHHHNFFNSLIKSKSNKANKTFSLSSRSFSDKHGTAAAAAASAATTADVVAASASIKSSSLGNASGASVQSLAASQQHQHHHHQQQISYTTIDSGRLLGTLLCPRLDEVPMLEPHLCKKVAHERLTGLVFRKDYFVIANQDGKVCIYSRPNKMTCGNPHHHHRQQQQQYYQQQQRQHRKLSNSSLNESVISDDTMMVNNNNNHNNENCGRNSVTGMMAANIDCPSSSSSVIV